MSKDLLLVIPCYNEARRLDVDQWASALAARPWLQALFVDDGSTDHTHEVLEALVDEVGDQASVLRLEQNQGKAEAVRQGVLAALQRQPHLLGYWDADLAAPISELDGMRMELDKGDVEFVLGSRVLMLGRGIKRRWIRHYLGRFFAASASLALDLPVYDTQCGAKVFRNTSRMSSVFREPFISRWIFDVEILARLIRHTDGDLVAEGCVVEYPLNRWTDVDGSKVRLAHTFRIPLELFRIWRLRRA